MINFHTLLNFKGYSIAKLIDQTQGQKILSEITYNRLFNVFFSCYH